MPGPEDRALAMDAATSGGPEWHPASETPAAGRSTGIVFRFGADLLAPCVAGGRVEVRHHGSYDLDLVGPRPSLVGRQTLFAGAEAIRFRNLRVDGHFDGLPTEIGVADLSRLRLAVFVRTRNAGETFEWDVDDLAMTVTFRDRCAAAGGAAVDDAAWHLDAADGAPAGEGAEDGAGPTWHAADEEERIVLRADGGPHLWAATPDSPANSVTGDIDLRARVAPQDWQGYALAVVTKWIDAVDPNGLATIDAYEIGTWTGVAFFEWTDPYGAEHIVIPRVPERSGPGEVEFRFTLDVDTGHGTHRAQYFERGPDGWALLDTQEFAGTTSIQDSPEPLEINSPHNMFKGDVLSAQVYDGIDGALVADFQPDRDARDTATRQFTSATSGEVWSLDPGALVRTGPTPPRVEVDSTHPLQVEWPAGLVSFDHDFTIVLSAVDLPDGGLLLGSATPLSPGWGLYLDPRVGLAGFYGTDGGTTLSDEVAILRDGDTVLTVRHRADLGDLEISWGGRSDGSQSTGAAPPSLPDDASVGTGPVACAFGIRSIAVWDRALRGPELTRVIDALG
jgi:hypothetical protein